jgi:hypothetical protein
MVAAGRRPALTRKEADMTKRLARSRKDARRHLDSLATLGTEAVLALHDRFIGKVEGRTRQRILQAARERGWDRTWDDGPFAA